MGFIKWFIWILLAALIASCIFSCTSTGWEYGMIREAKEAGCDLESLKASRERQNIYLECQ